jgi:outer membrane lipoprotein-sorting protein
MVEDDVAALINDCRHRWSTLRASGFEWRDHELLLEAFKRGAPPGGTWVQGKFTGPIPDREPWWLWISLPDDVRTEFRVGTETVTAVIKGSTWWSCAPSRGGRTNGGDDHISHGMGSGYPMTDPAALSQALAFGPTTSTTFLDRPALEVSAHPMDPESFDFDEQIHVDRAQSELGRGADEYRLHIDAERGLVLRSEARLEGRPFRVIEMEQISFDERLPDETFTLELPPDSSFKNAEEWRRELFGESRNG